MTSSDPIYGLIGKKLGHSFSKAYFTEKFAREGISAEYKLFEIPQGFAVYGPVEGIPPARWA